VHRFLVKRAQAFNHRLGGIPNKFGDESSLVLLVFDVGLGVLEGFDLVLKFFQDIGFGRSGMSEHGG
jgi:hypothetical protein